MAPLVDCDSRVCHRPGYDLRRWISRHRSIRSSSTVDLARSVREAAFRLCRYSGTHLPTVVSCWTTQSALTSTKFSESGPLTTESTSWQCTGTRRAQPNSRWSVNRTIPAIVERRPPSYGSSTTPARPGRFPVSARRPSRRGRHQPRSPLRSRSWAARSLIGDDVRRRRVPTGRLAATRRWSGRGTADDPWFECAYVRGTRRARRGSGAARRRRGSAQQQGT